MRTSLSVALVAFAVGCNNEPSNLDQLSASQVTDLTLETPAAAAWLSAGPVAATGDAVGLTGVTLEGVAAELDGTRWQAGIDLERGINSLELTGVDDAGHAMLVRQSVIAGTFGDPQGEVESALGLRLNRGGLDAATAAAADLLDAGEIEGTLTAMNPVYDDAYGLFGWDAVTVSADVGSLAFDPVQIDLEPAAGVMTLEVSLPNLDVWVPVYGEVVGIDFAVDAWLGAQSADVTALVSLGVDEQGALTVDLADTSVALDGFWYDTSLLPGEVESLLLVDTLRGTIEEMLVEQIEAQVPALLEEQLQALDLSFELDLLGTLVSLELRLDTATSDRDGVLLVADLDIAVPPKGDKTWEGYLLASEASPRPDTASDVAMVLSDDLMNRVLFEVWRGGLLDLSLSTDDGSLDPLMLAPLGARSEGSVVIDAGLPPVLVERDGGLELQVGELGVTVLTPGGDMGDRLVLSVAGRIPLDVAVEDNELALGLGTPELDLVVRDSDWGASDETVTRLLEAELPIDTLLLLLGDISFPLPEIDGFAIGSAVVERDASGVYTSVSASL